MGSTLSRVRSVVRLLLDMKADFEAVEARLKRSPGLPTASPSSTTTHPFWMVPPAAVADHQPVVWPENVDVVIIGSGITGASVTRALLDEHGSGLKVLMLEARAACSGATGRNGGHVNPPLFHDYLALRKEFGREVAVQTIRWRLSHLSALQCAAEAEDAIEHSQVRVVENLDVYYSQEPLKKAKEGLAAWREDMPEESRHVYCVEGDEARIKFHVGPGALGVISTPGGAAHPYRLVTTILAGLLRRHPESFYLATHTPCTAIDAPTPTSGHYTLHTPRGLVRAAHIVHATNGWTAHLLPGFRTKIAPVRALMSAQRPGSGLTTPAPSGASISSEKTLAPTPTEPGGRAHVFWTGTMGFDYLTQLPTPGNELMFGGGFARAARISMDEIGQMDDGGMDVGVATHVGGALPMYFGFQNWGKEGDADEDVTGKSQWPEGRVKAMWTGIIAISVDGRPWVGRVPMKVSERAEPQASLAPPIQTTKEQFEVMSTAPPGEWLAAGYTGEGMTNAWQAGRSVASLLLGKEPEELPLPMRVTEKRWRDAKLENLLDRF